VSKIPYFFNATEAAWDVKIILLICVFVFAFFRFTWALRQFNFCAIVIGAAPSAVGFIAQGEAAQASFANRVGKLIALAGESFNDGLRAYYFAIAALTWFLQPQAFMLATSIVVVILYYREFRSAVLHTLMSDGK
jgi:uncharacterized membrane protein